MRILAVVVALCLLAGCSATDTPKSRAPDNTAPAQSNPPTPSSKSLAAFCKDLVVFEVALVAFTADMGRPLVRPGELTDVSEAKRMAGIVVDDGKVLLSQAPPDIKDDLSTAIAATEEAVGHLDTPDLAGLLDASTVMYRGEVTTAREAIGRYPRCG